MLTACMTPELACEITLQPVRRHRVDAAILFSDIMVPLAAVGVPVRMEAGREPIVDEPIRDARRGSGEIVQPAPCSAQEATGLASGLPFSTT